MKTLLSIALLLACATAQAETEIVFRQLPTPIQIEGHSCGPTPVVYSSVGFSQNGNYVLAQVYADTFCDDGGKDGKTTEYKGCAIATWNLFGYLESTVRIPLSQCGTLVVYPLQGYSVVLEPLVTVLWGMKFYAPYPTPVLIIGQ
jgi:hypothetical protein